MQKKTYSLLILALSALFILACSVSGTGFGVVRGSGDVTRETRAVSGFDQVEVHGGGNLYLVQGESETLEIEAEDNLLPYLRSRVIDGTLILDFDDTANKSFITTRPVNYYLSMVEIERLEISGGGDIKAEDILTPSLRTGISGGGDLKIDSLKADMLEVHISGGGNIRLYTGEVTRQDIHLSGGGKYDAGDLQSQTVEANVSGGGDLIVWAEDSLNVSVSGGGSVYYYGSPDVESSISGGGDVVRREK